LLVRAQRLTVQTHNSYGSGFGGGGRVLGGADASSSSSFDEGTADGMINISSGDKEDV
jgi:hypothetical protein